jgi:predicted RNA-binding Zn ribbon-like protein
MKMPVGDVDARRVCGETQRERRFDHLDLLPLRAAAAAAAAAIREMRDADRRAAERDDRLELLVGEPESALEFFARRRHDRSRSCRHYPISAGPVDRVR